MLCFSTEGQLSSPQPGGLHSEGDEKRRGAKPYLSAVIDERRLLGCLGKEICRFYLHKIIRLKLWLVGLEGINSSLNKHKIVVTMIVFPLPPTLSLNRVTVDNHPTIRKHMIVKGKRRSSKTQSERQQYNDYQ